MPLRAANRGFRSLVAVYFSNAFQPQDLLGAPHLSDLYARKLLALVRKVPDSANSVSFLPGATVTHNISQGFESESTAVLPGAITAISIDGRILAESTDDRYANLQTAFPATPLGKHLRTVALAIANEQGNSVYTIVAKGPRGASPVSASLMSEIDGAFAAFYSALEEIRRAMDVALFTDVAGSKPGSTSTRLVLGGSVKGGQTVSARSAEQFADELAAWAGGSAPRKGLGLF